MCVWHFWELCIIGRSFFVFFSFEVIFRCARAATHNLAAAAAAVIFIVSEQGSEFEQGNVSWSSEDMITDLAEQEALA